MERVSQPAAGRERPRIALLGTSADPPTQGHRALLQGLLQRFEQVVTWASDNPLKSHTAPLELRCRLLAALVAAIGDPRLRLEQELSSPWAVVTLERARRRWPQAEPVLVVGSDLSSQIPRWKDAERLLAGTALAIVPRQGWPVQPADLEALRRLGARPELLDLAIPASASSQLRRSLEGGQLPEELRPLLLQDNPYSPRIR